MSTYRREHYLAKLRPFYNDSGLIKVITGIRRCGKSSLLITVLNELFEQGIPETNLIYLNLDRREYRNVTTPDQLDQLIEQAMSNAYGAGLRYLFIDEVQNVKGFETVINGWREEGNCSIFITGSNSYLLSGELATKLTGRYIKLEMFTLSFQEYLGMRNFLNKPEFRYRKPSATISHTAGSRNRWNMTIPTQKPHIFKTSSGRSSTRTSPPTKKYAIAILSPVCRTISSIISQRPRIFPALSRI